MRFQTILTQVILCYIERRYTPHVPKYRILSVFLLYIMIILANRGDAEGYKIIAGVLPQKSSHTRNGWRGGEQIRAANEGRGAKNTSYHKIDTIHFPNSLFGKCMVGLEV